MISSLLALPSSGGTQKRKSGRSNSIRSKGLCRRCGTCLIFSRNDGSEPRLYDAQSDPRQERELADDDPDTVGMMFEDYVLKDAGGWLPNL